MDVPGYLESIADERRRTDARLLIELMEEVTGEPPVEWGSGIVGFGTRHYRYDSGREGDVALVGFAARKAQTVLYLTGYLEAYGDLLAKLGPYKAGKGCLYLKRVGEADPAVLREIIERSYQGLRA